MYQLRKRRRTEPVVEKQYLQLYEKYCTGRISAVIQEIEAKRTMVIEKKGNPDDFYLDKRDTYFLIARLFTNLSHDVVTKPSKCIVPAFKALTAAIRFLIAMHVSLKNKEREVIKDVYETCGVSVARFSQVITSLLESGERTPTDVKLRLFNLMNALATPDEGLKCICANTQLMDRLAIFLDFEDERFRLAAIDTVIYLSRKPVSFTMLLHCNIGYHFGALLARFTPAQLADTENALSKKLLKIFSQLVKTDRNKLCRQLEGSPGPAVLVEFIFMSDENPHVREYQQSLITLLGYCVLREAFGLPVLRRIVETYDSSGIKLKYLCVITQDAWGRNALREHGGLEILLDACGERFDPQATMISKHLRHYMHDAKGLSAIVRNEAFMDKLLRMIEKYSDAHENCKGNTSKLHKVEIGLRPDAPNFIEQLNELEDKTQTSYMKRTTFSKDLRDLTAMDPPPQAGSYVPLNMWSASSPVRSPTHSSPSMSPRSLANDDQGSMSDSSMSSEDSEAARSPVLADIELHQDSSIYDEDILVCGRKICPNLLNLISWISHNPENHKCLMRRPILEMLLKCMSRGVPSDVMKTAKACILRLVKSPTILTHFLELKMHITVIRTLLRLPCLIQRYARRCVQCDERRSAGREIIQELSLHTCTTSGWAFMEALLKKNDPDVHLFACSAGVVLVRQSSYRPQMIRRFEPLMKLMNRFTAILNEGASITVPEGESSEDALHQARIDFFMSNNANFEMIIFAFSSILTYKVQQDVLKSQMDRQSTDETTKEDKRDACRINIDDIPVERQVIFKLADGTALATVDMDALCANSEYYRGMFENNFAERTQGIREFTLGTDDSLIIHETHYKKFLHRLAGCTAKTCAGIEDTATCISLLYLADKYLAINLLDLLIFKNGLAEKFVCGNTLADFIPILLNSSLATHAPLSKLFFLIFLRYSSMESIYEVFNVVIEVRSLDSFINLLRSFLNECWKTLPDHPSYRVWV